VIQTGKKQCQNYAEKVHEKRYDFKKDPILVDVVHVPST